MRRLDCEQLMGDIRFGARREKVNFDAWDEVRVALDETWDWAYSWMMQGYPAPSIWLTRCALRQLIRKYAETSTHGMRKRTEA